MTTLHPNHRILQPPGRSPNARERGAQRPTPAPVMPTWPPRSGRISGEEMARVLGHTPSDKTTGPAVRGAAVPGKPRRP